MSEIAPLDVACPFCLALIGEPCNPNHGPYNTHLIPPLTAHVSRIRASNEKFNASLNSEAPAR